jgi:hypothetical protein
MSQFTRRTHVVRIHDDDADGSGQYVDVEVVDAVSFRTDNGKEMILNMPAEKAVPYIVDDTGDGSEKTPSRATRRSHMERIKGDPDKTQFFDVEVLDMISFRGQNGEEWILVNPSKDAVPFNKTDGGSGRATRRTHTEKVGLTGATQSDGEITIERCDMMAFRTMNGQEMIIKMESYDDGSGDRAETKIDPDGYDPKKAKPEPPKNTDPHVYVKFVKGGGVQTGKTKIAQGPLWWIRKVGFGAIVFVTVEYTITSKSAIPATPGIQLINMPYGQGIYNVLGTIDEALPDASPAKVENPVTDAMLDTLYQWTPSPVFEDTKGAVDPGTTIYYVDNGATELFPFHIPLITDVNKDNYLRTDLFGFDYFGPTDQGELFTVIGSRAGVFFGKALNTLSPTYLAQQAGFDPSRLGWQGNIYLKQEDAQYFSDANNAALSIATPGNHFNTNTTVKSFELSQGDQFFKRTGVAIFELNYAQLKGAWAKQPPNNHPVTFTIKVTSTGDHQETTVSAQVFKKQRDFSLGPKNTITFVSDPVYAPDAGGVTNSGLCIGTIAPKPDDPKTLQTLFTTG